MRTIGTQKVNPANDKLNPEAGVNELADEALVAIVAGRLRPFPKRAVVTVSNPGGPQHVQAALQARARWWTPRGVESTRQV